jgi:plasmid segregation protein ParM
MNDVLVGVDVGYGETKVAFPELGAPCYTSFASIAEPVPGNEVELGGGLHKRDTLCVLVDGKRFEVGRDAELIAEVNSVRALHDDYIETTEYRAKLYAALLAAKQPRITRLVTGLPVSHMAQHRDRLVRLLTGRHQVSDDFAVTIDDVQVIPQPLGGLLDYSAEQRNRQLVRDLTVLVIDPGYYTTDWLIVDRLRAVKQRSDSRGIGMHHVLQAARDRIKAQHGGGAPAAGKLADALKAGIRVPFRKGSIDVLPIAEEAARALTETVGSAIKNVVNDFSDIDLVLLVGGGATVFRPAIEAMVAGTGLEVEVAHSAGFANVRGYYILGERMASQVIRAVK